MRRRPLLLFSICSCSLYFLNASTGSLNFIHPVFQYIQYVIISPIKKTITNPPKCEQDILIRCDPGYTLH